MSPTTLAETQAQAEDKPGHRRFNTYKLPEWVRHPSIERPEKVAILFPGEQNHYIGMLKDAKRNSEVQRMLASASQVFGFDLEELMANGPMDKMAQTGNNQCLAFVANCAAFEIMKASHPKAAGQPQGTAGFSIGEYNALVVAGVITFEQGLSLVKIRAEAMEALTKEVDMDAINLTGFDYSKAEGFCSMAKKRDTGEDPQVYVAQLWGPTGIVCAGRRSTVKQLEEWASHVVVSQHKEHKAKDEKASPTSARLLGQPATHTPLVQKAGDAVADALDRMLPAMKPPRCELYLNATGWRVAPGTKPAQFISALKEQLTSAVMWEGCIDQMQRWGISSFYECGPGRSLMGFMQQYEFMQECPLQITRPADKVFNITV